MPLAGSAIAQSAGKIDEIDGWIGTTADKRWFLLVGATDPPEDIAISDRRTRDVKYDKNGAFLQGVTRDVVNMQDAIGGKLYNRVMDLYLTKSEALNKIQRFFQHCLQRDFKPMLYYTGHGQVGTGNWCFDDGTISIEEIVDLIPVQCYYPTIISDACYSGNWANYCCEENIGGFTCLSACPEYCTTVDIAGMLLFESSIESHEFIKFFLFRQRRGVNYLHHW